MNRLPSLGAAHRNFRPHCVSNRSPFRTNLQKRPSPCRIPGAAPKRSPAACPKPNPLAVLTTRTPSRPVASPVPIGPGHPHSKEHTHVPLATNSTRANAVAFASTDRDIQTTHERLTNMHPLRVDDDRYAQPSSTLHRPIRPRPCSALPLDAADLSTTPPPFLVLPPPFGSADATTPSVLAITSFERLAPRSATQSARQLPPRVRQAAP